MAGDLVSAAGGVLLDRSRPLAERFRALFALRNLNGPQAVGHIVKCFEIDDSALLKHELAYCLGQMRADSAVDDLIRILSMTDGEHAMVRHECAEALGAIGDPRARHALQRHADAAVEPAHEVRQTCELALRRIDWLLQGNDGQPRPDCPFSTIDPSPADEKGREKDVNALSDVLCDVEAPLWDRYTAMFALRNRNTEEAALALARGLRCPDSALLRHEVAYVLGQMRCAATAGPLADRLALADEASMVRHECAEALGSVADDTCDKLLRRYLTDPDRIVRESAQVALDMAQYENSDCFQPTPVES